MPRFRKIPKGRDGGNGEGVAFEWRLSASTERGSAHLCRKGQYDAVHSQRSKVGMVRISVGKLRGLEQISNDAGRFTMVAMDQRGSLQKMLHPENPKAATYAEMEAVKLAVTEALAPLASGYLLDPEFGVGPAINRFALPGRTGPLVSMETPGYEKKGNWRLTTLLDGWSVEKVKRLGASAAKLLIFFNPDAPREVVDHQVKIVRDVAEE